MSICRILLLLVGLTTLAGFRAPLEGAYSGVGTEAPDAAVVDLDGAPRSLFDGSSSGWTLLRFGTTWCPQCAEETRELNEISTFLEAKGVEVVEVFLRDTPEQVRAVLATRPRTYPVRVLIDLEGRTVALYRVRVIPRVLLVGPEGVVRLDATYLSSAELETRIAKALAPPP